MLYKYKYNNNCIYVPIHMNLVFFRNVPGIKIPDKINIYEICKNIDTFFISYLVDNIMQMKYTYYLLDFSEINDADSRSFLPLKALLEKGFNIIIYNINENLKSMIFDDDCVGLLDKDSILDKILANNIGLQYFNSTLNNSGNLSLDIVKFKANTIAMYLKESKDNGKESTDKDYYLTSSNVYVTKYIDIKKIFSDNEIFYLSIYEICRLIEKSLVQFDCLICSSNNGAALATIIGQVLNINVLYLLNLGPNLTIRDKELINRISPRTKYFYIFDFICLGTEYKLLNTILKIKGAELSGAIGIAKYVDIDRDERNLASKIDEKIFQIFRVNDESYDFGYEVKVGK